MFQLKFIYFSDGQSQDGVQEKQRRTRQAVRKVQRKMPADQRKKSGWNKEAKENASHDIKKRKEEDSDWRKERTVIALCCSFEGEEVSEQIVMNLT